MFSFFYINMNSSAFLIGLKKSIINKGGNMAKQKNEKVVQTNETKKKNVNKNKSNKPNKNKKGVFNKKQSKSNVQKTRKESKPQKNKSPKKPDVNVRIAFLESYSPVRSVARVCESRSFSNLSTP